MPTIRTRLIITVLCAAPSACAMTAQSPPVPQLPAGVFGVYEDNDFGALNQSAWAFADPRRTSGNPTEAAQAVIAVEYLADELRANPRWIALSASSKLGMVHAREDTRRLLGIRPDAPPSQVIDALLRFTAAESAGDQGGALRALGTPAFTSPPSETLRILANLPYIASANRATSQASNEAPGNGRR